MIPIKSDSSSQFSEAPSPQAKSTTTYHNLFLPLRKMVLGYVDPLTVITVVRQLEKKEEQSDSNYLFQDIPLDYLKNLAAQCKMDLMNKWGACATPSFSYVTNSQQDMEQLYQKALLKDGLALCQFVRNALIVTNSWGKTSDYRTLEEAANTKKLSEEDFLGIIALASEASHLSTIVSIKDVRLPETCIKALHEQEYNNKAADILKVLIRESWSVKGVIDKVKEQFDSKGSFGYVFMLRHRFDIVECLLKRPELTQKNREDLLIDFINFAENEDLIRQALLKFFALIDPSFPKKVDPETRFELSQYLAHYKVRSFEELMGQTNEMVLQADLKALQSLIWHAFARPVYLSKLKGRGDKKELLRFMSLISSYINIILHSGDPNIPENYFALLPVCLVHTQDIVKISSIIGKDIVDYDIFITPILQRNEFLPLLDVVKTIPDSNPFKKRVEDAAHESKGFSKERQNTLLKLRIYELLYPYSKEIRAKLFSCYVFLAEDAPQAVKSGFERILNYPYSKLQRFFLLRQYAIANAKVECASSPGFFYQQRLNKFLAKITQIPLTHTDPSQAMWEIQQLVVDIFSKNDKLYKCLYFHCGRLGSCFDFKLDPPDFKVSDIQSETAGWKSLVEQEQAKNKL